MCVVAVAGGAGGGLANKRILLSLAEIFITLKRFWLFTRLQFLNYMDKPQLA